MRYRDLHWRRGLPEQPGIYLVFEREACAVRVAEVIGTDPLRLRGVERPERATWRFAAYLGPLPTQQRP